MSEVVVIAYFIDDFKNVVVDARGRLLRASAPDKAAVDEALAEFGVTTAAGPDVYKDARGGLTIVSVLIPSCFAESGLNIRGLGDVSEPPRVLEAVQRGLFVIKAHEYTYSAAWAARAGHHVVMLNRDENDERVIEIEIADMRAGGLVRPFVDFGRRGGKSRSVLRLLRAAVDAAREMGGAQLVITPATEDLTGPYLGIVRRSGLPCQIEVDEDGDVFISVDIKSGGGAR